MGFVLAAGAAALALLAHGGRFSDRLDVLTTFAPLCLVGALLAVPISFFGTGAIRRAGLALSAVGALAAGALIAPEYLRDAGPVAPPGSPGEIKVIQFNVWRGNRDLPRIVDWLQAENPDVLVLEEVTPPLRELILHRTRWNVAGELSSDMIFTHPHYTVMNRPVEPGNVTLTWINGTYPSASGPFEAVVANEYWPTSPQQATQSAVLRDVVSRLPRHRMVLGGDFNSTPWSFRRRRDDIALGLIRRDRGVATWPTGYSGPWPWPAPLPLLAIDHIYAGPGWATTGVRRGPRLGSDHYPLIVTLAPVARP